LLFAATTGIYQSISQHVHGAQEQLLSTHSLVDAHAQKISDDINRQLELVTAHRHKTVATGSKLKQLASDHQVALSKSIERVVAIDSQATSSGVRMNNLFLAHCR
jgi:hypothetical protein